MYVTLGIFLLLILWTVSGFTQKREPRDTDLERIRRHMELREELHRKMLDNLMSGRHDEDLFRDMENLFNEAMKESFSGTGGSSFTFSFGEQNFQSEWQESAQGRTLLITPRTKEQKLDINVQNGMVTIKGKTRNSEFQNSFSIPQDCDSTRVKMDQKEGKIVMFFPWIKLKKTLSPKDTPKDNRVPLPKGEEDVTI